MSERTYLFCDFAIDSDRVCDRRAEYITSRSKDGQTSDGPDLCGDHLGARIEALLGLFETIHVARIPNE